jgi:transcriptional regulator with XRE-family HTH domain
MPKDLLDSTHPDHESSEQPDETGTDSQHREHVSMSLVELAQRIKQLRQERRLTIEQLATGTGLTRSWLSKVENFRVTPSLPALFRIAKSLGVTLAQLVEGLEEAPALCVVRRGAGLPIDRDPSPHNDTRYYSLAHHRLARKMDPFLLHLPPGGGRAQRLSHEGEEFLTVLQGRVAFQFGADRVDLEQGDSLYFDGATPHRVFNPHAEPAEVVCVFLAAR